MVSLWLTYHSLPSILMGGLWFVYQIDKVYKKPLTDQGKEYSLLKGGIYNKTKGRN